MSFYKYAYRYGQREEPETEQPVRWYEPEEHEMRGVAGHGLSAYRWRRCRCPVCCAAKAADARQYRQRLNAGRRSSQRWE